MISVKYFLNDYNPLDKEISGLPHKIRLDCNSNYKESIINRNRHLIVDDRYIVELDNHGIDKYDVLSFWIDNNYKDLCLLSDGEISYEDFVRTLERKKLIESKGLIEEMSVIQPSQSGVGLKIWVDEVGQWKNVEHNLPRVKVESPKGNNNTRQWIPIILPDLKVVDKTKLDINGKMFKKLMKFLSFNKKNIMDVSNGVITYDEFMRKMTTLDLRGNAIFRYKNDVFYQVDKITYGYILAENPTGYFTFFNKNGEIINKEMIFDGAESFINVNGKIYSNVIYKGEKYKLDINGKLSR